MNRLLRAVILLTALVGTATLHMQAAPAVGTTAFNSPASGGFTSQFNLPSPVVQNYLGYKFTSVSDLNAGISHAASRVNVLPSTASPVSNPIRVAFGSDDGSEFKASSWNFRATNATWSGTLTVTGFRDGSAVSGAVSTFNVAASATDYTWDVTADTDFNYVDELRITGPTVGNGGVSFNSITVATGIPPASNNADLSALSTTAGSISFSAATTGYAVNVANGVTTTTVTATRAEANATLAVQVNGGGFNVLTSGAASGNLALNVGANPIDVRVTAQDGTTIKTYTITVTRAGSLIVTNLNDSGTGSLRAAIDTANATPSQANITFQAGLSGTISLTSMLPMVRNPFGVSINGAGATITVDGGSSSTTTGDRILFFGVKGSDGTALTATDSTAWTVANLTLQNGNARGGAGGTGSSINGGWSGGGAGAGMGGAVFVNAGSATLTNVTLLNNRAVGGEGGSLSGAVAEGGTGGGGGMGGNGGNGSFFDAGGGGGFGLGANGGNGTASGSAGQYFGGASTQAGAGSGASGATGGLSGGGGGGGSNNQNGGGGSAGGAAATDSGPPGGSGKGGDGGFGGGGGAGGGNATQIGGTGGYGGGGGGAGTASGGAGGFGGGGGAGASGGVGGFAAGAGSGGYQGGGGGAGLGAAIFVRQGASVTVSGGSISGGLVSGGAGSNGGGGGLGIGTAAFLAGAMTYEVGTGQTVTIPSGTTFGGGTDALITGGFTKSGDGTLISAANHNYTGATAVNGGRLLVNASLIGSSSVTVASTATLGGTGTINGTVSVQNGGSLAPGASAGILNTGSAAFASGSTFAAEINGATVGTQYDQLNVTGTVSLGGATLALTGSYTPLSGNAFTLISNDGTDPVTNTFNGLAQGATLTFNGVPMTISYAGGTGNDVVLTLANTAPTVTTAAQSAVTATSATLGGNVTADGGATVTERGIVWKTSTGPTTADNKVQNGSGTGTFSATVNSLPAGTTVYVRAYAINSVNTSYGNEISFSTLSNNADLSALTLTTATINETFAAATTTYTSSVPNATSSVTVTATRAQANATIEARVGANAFASVTSGSPSASLPLAVGPNPIDVKVTAQDGTTIKTYTITVTRAAGVPDYTVVTTSGTLTVTDQTGNSDTLAITAPVAGSILFAATGRTFSVNGALQTTGNSGNVSLTGITSIIVNAATGTDILNVGAFTGTSFPSLTLNGGIGDDTVNLNGDITFVAGASLDVDLQNDDATPGTDIVNVATNANLLTSDTGTITVKVSMNVAMAAGSSFETVNGNLTVDANQQTTPTAGTFSGIDVNGGLVRSAGTGVVSVRGKGGNSGANQQGVRVSGGGDIIGGTTGTATISGTGGATTGVANYGVIVIATGSNITSNGANLQVTGQGGGSGAASTDNIGVGVASSGQILATGSASLTVNGTGGSTSGAVNEGVLVSSLGRIGTANGNLTVTGTGGGTGISAAGVDVFQNGIISATGSGTVTINGTGSASGSGTENYGVWIETTIGNLSSNTGAIQITATSGAGSAAFKMDAAATATLTTTNAPITVIADSMAISVAAVFTAGSANAVTLRQKTNGQLINLGAADSATTLGLTDAELDRITAGTLNIGDSNSGAITVSAGISPASYKTLALMGSTTFAATGGFTADVTSASVFERITAIGTINITAGAALTMASAGGYVWNGADTFTLIDNDAADAITGTFTGPTLTNFLGSTLTATQSYTGGTGNDLVFAAPLSSNADLSTLVINTATYSPAFAAGTTTGYTASVSNATSSVTVTPTRAQANATIEARSNANAFASVTSGSPSGALALNLGSNTLDVKVTAQDGTTTKTYSIVVTRVGGVPGAPTVGTATAGTNANATVTFSAPASDGGSPITSYSVTSAPGGVVNVGATSPITISGLTPGIVYTFRVQAFNANGPSALSAASNSITAVTVPGAPTIGTAAAGNATASVAFTAPGSTGGSAILDYTVTSSPGGITATSATSPISVTGLTNGTPYTFTVTARNAVGTGAASGASNSVTPVAPAEIPLSLASGTLTIDATGSAGAADTKVSIVDLGGGVFVLEITDPNRTIGTPAGGTQVDSKTVRIPIGLVGNIVINGTSLGDQFTLDLSSGTLPGGITVNGNLPTTPPGDSLRVIGAYNDITYGPDGVGSGNIDVDGTAVAFMGFEPVDFSGASIGNLTVTVDPSSLFAGDVITTIASVDAGVNTLITFADNAGVANGLESIKIGALTGTLTVEGDNVENDFFDLVGLGSAMVGHVSLDGKGGSSDVIIIKNTTVTMAGAGKDFTAKADFIATGRFILTAPGDLPGTLVCSGNITLEADGDSSIATPTLFGASSVWTIVPTTPIASAYLGNAVTSATWSRGSIVHRGVVRKASGADATTTFKAKANVTLQNATPGGGTVIATSNKLHTILHSDSDNSGQGAVSLGALANVTTNGGNLTIGGGLDPATSPARGLTGIAAGVVFNAATVNTGGGNLSVRGQGAALGLGHGVTMLANNVLSPCSIQTGAGNITIIGIGGATGTGSAHGVQIQGDTAGVTSTSAITTSTGTINISGTATSSVFNHGVNITSLVTVSSSGGSAVNINGTGIVTGFGLNLAPGTGFTSTLQSTNGSITLTADTMNLNGGAGTETISTGSSTSGTVTLKPLSAGKNIQMGAGVVDGSDLAIDSATELPNLTAGTVNVGDATSDLLVLFSVISPSTFTTLGLNSTQIIFTSVSGFTADVTSASQFEKIIATGYVSVDSAASFSVNSAGGYVWNGTDSFTFLTNEGIDAISGTFTGPTLTNFLGTSLTAQQTYTGGTGNDFVIFAPPSSNADLSALVVNTATYSPAFAAGTTTGYTASVSNATSSVTVTPTRAQANATIEARSNANAFASVTSGSPSGALALNLGSNTIDVKVTAQDGTTIKTYTITVTRRSLIEDWRLGFFADASGTSNRANGADFDLDGKTNLLEFAFGTDPTLGSSGPPDLTMTGTYAAAVFGVTGQPITKLEPITNGVDYRAVFIRRVDHAAAGLTYTPEFSGDNFTSFTPSATIPTVLATSGSFQLVSVPYPHFLPNGKKARFFRVSVSIAP